MLLLNVDANFHQRVGQQGVAHACTQSCAVRCGDRTRVVDKQAAHGPLRQQNGGAAVGKAALPAADGVAEVVLAVGVELAEKLSQGGAHEVGVVVGEDVPLLVGEGVVGELEAGDELRTLLGKDNYGTEVRNMYMYRESYL